MATSSQMREYETIYVMRPDLDDNKAAEIMLAKKAFIEKLGGKNIKVDALGRRKLSWVCKKQTRGIFVHHHYLGLPGIVADFDRSLSIDDQILMRHSVVLKYDVDAESIAVQEDSLVPPVFEKKREFGDRRNSSKSDFYDRDDDFDRGRSFDGGYDDYEDDN